MARTDDFREAFRLAGIEIAAANPHHLARKAGVEVRAGRDGHPEIPVPFLDGVYAVSVGNPVEVTRESDAAETPLPVKVLIAHYLLRAPAGAETGEDITFREIPDGHFYFDAFQRRARDPLVATFGTDPELFAECAKAVGGTPAGLGDASALFRVFPRIPVRLVLWRGDDEFPPEAAILFDANLRGSLSAEDIAVMSGMLVYRLMGRARELGDAPRT